MQFAALTSALFLASGALAAPTGQSFSQMVAGVKAHDAAITGTVASYSAHTLSAADAASYARGNASAIHDLITSYSAPSSVSQSEASSMTSGYHSMVADLASTFAGLQAANIPGMNKATTKRAGGVDIGTDLKGLVTEIQKVDSDIDDVESAVDDAVFTLLKTVVGGLEL